MIDEPLIGRRQPVLVELVAGKIYWRYRCGRSQSQPFCAMARIRAPASSRWNGRSSATAVRFCAPGCAPGRPSATTAI
jgi:hypothetical protein